MSPLAQIDLGQSVQQGVTGVVAFVPKLLAFVAILVIGWVVARVIRRVVARVLERVGFDRAVERGGIKQALARADYDASDLLARLVFFAVMLFVLQLAFGVFGPNPISALLFGIIAFLPKIFVAIVIVVVAAAIASMVRELIAATIGALSYGRTLANAAAVVIVGIGVFAALNQIEIAPEIINGVFYALLAIVVGVTVVAVGGGGIAPMRGRWEVGLARLTDASSRVREHASTGSADAGPAEAVRRDAAATDVEAPAHEGSTDGALAAGDDDFDEDEITTELPAVPEPTVAAQPTSAAPPGQIDGADWPSTGDR